MLRKGIYPYEYMNSRKRFYETMLPDKEDFDNSLSMVDITDDDSKYAKNMERL